jgi:hypothetical protein
VGKAVLNFWAGAQMLRITFILGWTDLGVLRIFVLAQWLRIAFILGWAE